MDLSRTLLKASSVNELAPFLRKKKTKISIIVIISTLRNEEPKKGYLSTVNWN